MTPEVIERSVDDVIATVDRLLASITIISPDHGTFSNTFEPLDAALDRLHQALWQYAFMSYVAGAPAVRDAGRAAAERLKLHLVGLWFREDIYDAVRAVARYISIQGDEQQRFVAHALREYRRRGSGLPAATRTRIRRLTEEIDAIEIRYQQRIDEWGDSLSPGCEQSSGLPSSPAESAALRRCQFMKDETVGGMENVTALERALGIRHELAGLLGYDSWAAFRHEACVAGRRDIVDTFLRDMRDRLLPHARDELGLLETVHGGPLSIWDQDFAISRALHERYRLSRDDLAAYFPFDACLDGLFDICHALFDLTFVARPDVSVWHDDVRAFDIHDGDAPEPCARFYLDLFPRPNKFRHVAVFEMRRGRRRADGTYQKPVAVMVGNFTRRGPEAAALLGHRDVVQLFHEFGHVLHFALAKGAFSSIDVEADFIEVPSQLLERWAFSRGTLAAIARHYETGAALPDSLLDEIPRMESAYLAPQTLRDIYYASVDLALHSPDFRGDSTAVVRDLHRITMHPYTPETYFQAGWWHLFTYDARYYGYLWAQVYADDIFGRFQQAGLLDRRVGMEFRRKVLERRGAADGGAVVRDFLGRAPTIEAFMGRFDS